MGCLYSKPTLVLLRCIVVVDLLSDALALAQVAGQILLLLLIVVAEELFPVVWIHVLLLLDDLPFHLLLLLTGAKQARDASHTQKRTNANADSEHRQRRTLSQPS